MTEGEKLEISRDLRELFDDGLSFETCAFEIDLEEGTPEYAYAKSLWEQWEDA